MSDMLHGLSALYRQNVKGEDSASEDDEDYEEDSEHDFTVVRLKEQLMDGDDDDNDDNIPHDNATTTDATTDLSHLNDIETAVHPHLTCYYGNQWRIAYTQLRSHAQRCYDGDLRTCVREFLPNVLCLLHEIKQNHQESNRNWPFCSENAVLIHLTEITFKLSLGDFYIVIKIINSQPKLVIRYKDNDGIKEWIPNDTQCISLFQMDKFENQITNSGNKMDDYDYVNSKGENCDDKELCRLLQNCVVAMETGYDAVKWNILKREGLIHINYDAKSLKKDNNLPLKKKLEPTSCKEGISGEKSNTTNNNNGPKVGPNAAPPGPFPGPYTKLDPPRSIMDVDHQLLQSGVAILPGSRDVHGGAVVCLFTSSDLWLHQQISSTELARLIMYYYTIPKEATKTKGLTVVVDIRGASPSTVNTLLDALFTFQANVIRGLSAMLFVTSPTNQDLVLRSPVYHPSPNLDITMVTTKEMLFNFIDITQVPSVLHGYFPYNHDDWLRFQMKLEPFALNLRSTSQHLINTLVTLTSCDLHPLTVKDTSLLMLKHQHVVDRTLNEPQLLGIQNDGPSVLQDLTVEESVLGHSIDFRQSMEGIQQLHAQLQETLKKLVEVTDVRMRGLEQCLQIRQFEEECQKMLEWLRTEGDDIIQRHRVTDDTSNLKAIRVQQRHFEKLYFSAMAQVEKGNDLLDEAAMLDETGSYDDGAGYKTLARALKRHLNDFTGQLEESREMIGGTARCYSLLDKSYEWAVDVIRYISSMKTDHSTSLDHLHKLLRSLDVYLLDHPPPISADMFSAIQEQAQSLHHHKLLDQCRTAKTRCDEITNLLRLHHSSLLQAIDKLNANAVVNSQNYDDVSLTHAQNYDLSSKLYGPTCNKYNTVSSTSSMSSLSSRSSIRSNHSNRPLPALPTFTDDSNNSTDLSSDTGIYEKIYEDILSQDMKSSEISLTESKLLVTNSLSSNQCLSSPTVLSNCFESKDDKTSRKDDISSHRDDITTHRDDITSRNADKTDKTSRISKPDLYFNLPSNQPTFYCQKSPVTYPDNLTFENYKSDTVNIHHATHSIVYRTNSGNSTISSESRLNIVEESHNPIYRTSTPENKTDHILPSSPIYDQTVPFISPRHLPHHDDINGLNNDINISGINSGVSSPVTTESPTSSSTSRSISLQDPMKQQKKIFRRSNTAPVSHFDLKNLEEPLHVVRERLTTRPLSCVTGSDDSLPSMPEDEELDFSCQSSYAETPRRSSVPTIVNSHLRLADALKTNQKTLSLIMSEMIQTEQDYVAALEYIIDNYIPELSREDVPQGLRGKRNIIFGNIEKIFEFHRQYFLREIEYCEKRPFHIANYFILHETHLHLYALYNKNKPKSDQLMHELGKDFFRKKQIELGDKMDLSSYLLKPVQRMGKYALLLKQMIKECGEKEPDYQDLKKAEEMVKFQLRHGNDLLAMDSLRNCDVNLQEQGRLLRQEEFLVWQGRKKTLRRVFLFEDLILFSKTRQNRSGGHDTYIYKYSIKTSDIGLTEDYEDSPFKFEIWFRRRKNGENYILQAPDMAVKTAWINEIAGILWKQAITNREKRLTEMATMGIGSKPCMDIKPSSDNINDRFVNISLSNRQIRCRNSIAVGAIDYRNNKRPHSLISIGSSSSSSSNQSGPQHGHIYEALADCPPYTRVSIATSSNESGICADIYDKPPRPRSYHEYLRQPPLPTIVSEV